MADSSSRPGDLLSDILARPLASSLVGLTLLAAYAGATWWTAGWSLTLEQHFLSRSHGIWLTAWMVLGGSAAALLAPSLATVAARRGWTDRVTALWARGTDAQWCAVAAAVALVLPVLVRVVVLMNLPLVNDETSYRFSAEILATGHLTAPSPPLKLFFDNGFVINDGRMYTQYFLGWPALLVPAVLLGVPGFANAAYAGLTAPAVFLVARRLAGSAWARVAMLLFLTSPMLMLGAANGMSHTTTFGALAWLLWATLRSRDPDAPLWVHGLVGLSFGVAFFIRPTSAFGTGVAPVLYWAWGWTRLPRARKPAVAAAFLLPAVALGAMFLGVNLVQNGGISKVAYFSYIQYMAANENRFGGLEVSADSNYPINSLSPLVMARVVLIAAIRLNGGLFGWPASLVFAPLARQPGTRLLWAMVATHFAVHMSLLDVGVETYGPVHYFETSLPLLVLSVLGLKALAAGHAQDADPARRAAPYALLAILIALSAGGYWPVHVHALHDAATSVSRPYRAVAGLQRAVVFASRPFAPRCPQDTTRNFMDWRPDSGPRWDEEVVWVNHITVYADRKLMRDVFPERTGYVLQFEAPCTWRVIPLATEDLSIPDADIRGSGRLEPEYVEPPP